MNFYQFVNQKLDEDVSEQIKKVSEKIKQAMRLALDGKEIVNKEDENKKVVELRNKLMELKKKQREESSAVNK
jgi:hypothetical protein